MRSSHRPERSLLVRHYDDGNLIDEEWEQVRDFARFVRGKRRAGSAGASSPPADTPLYRSRPSRPQNAAEGALHQL